MVELLLAAVAFTGTYDQTMACRVAIQGGVPVVRLAAHDAYTTVTFGKKFSLVGSAGLQTGDGQSVGGISGVPDGYGFPTDGSCKPAARIPLARSGLPLYEVFTPGEAGLGSLDNGATCLVGAQIRVRVHAVVSSDRATSGTLAFWTGTKKLRPVGYVEWMPKRVAVYFSDDCRY
jgi:hypothetical protein